MAINRLHDNPRLAWAAIPKGSFGFVCKTELLGCTTATISITDSCTEEMAVTSLREAGYSDEEIYVG